VSKEIQGGAKRDIIMGEVVPISVQVPDRHGLGKVELIDKYLTERAEEPQHKGILGQFVPGTSKDDKLRAAREIKKCVEAGDDLETIYHDIFNSINDGGELRSIYNTYKTARQDCLARISVARNSLPTHMIGHKDPPIPVSLKNKFGAEKISEYADARRSDPRETKGFGAMLMSMVGNDAYTKTGKLRAATLLENAIIAGVPLALVYNTESSAFSDGELSRIYHQYEAEQEKIKRRLIVARQQRGTGNPPPQSPQAAEKRNTSPATSNYSKDYSRLKEKYAKS